MSLDAMVWLVVGIGVGVGACLLVLILYAGLEHWRLGRRLRRARVLKSASPREHAQPPAPAGSKLALLDEKKARGEQAAPATSLVQAPRARVEPVVQPVSKQETLAPRPEPAAVKLEPAVSEPAPSPRAAPVFTVVRAEPEDALAAEAAPTVEVADADVVETSPVPAPAAEAEPADSSPALAPRQPQSVEDMFAEAFALDKVAVAPFKGDKDDGG